MRGRCKESGINGQEENQSLEQEKINGAQWEQRAYVHSSSECSILSTTIRKHATKDPHPPHTNTGTETNTDIPTEAQTHTHKHMHTEVLAEDTLSL